ncbi:ATP-binding protein [Azospirillum sp. sgz301742]
MLTNDRADFPAARPGPLRDGLTERIRQTLGSVRFLMVASGAAFIVVVNTLIGYGIWQHYGETMESVRTGAQHLARTLESDAVRGIFGVDQLFADVRYVLNIHPEAGTRAAPGIHEYLRGRRDAVPQIVDLVVVDADGHIRHHSADRNPPPLDLTDRSYFTAHRDRADAGLHIGTPTRSRVFPDTTVIPMSRRLNNPDGSFAGVLVVMVSPAYLESSFANLRNGLRGTATLALPDGTVVVHQPAEEALFGATLADWPALTEALRAGEDTMVLKTADRRAERMVSFRHVRDYPFVVVTTVALDDALADWRRDTAAWTFIGVSMTSAIAMLTWFVVRQHRRREQDQEKLTQASRRIRGILESMVDAVVTIDARGRIETFNPAAEQMFGYSEAELVGQSVSLLIPEGFRRDHDRWLQDYRPGEASRIIGADREVQAMRRGGATFPMNLAVSELVLHDAADKGRGRVFVGVIRDITQRKQKEAELLAAKSQAEMANRAKSEFLANMSHELRTPLNAIIGFSEVLDSEFFGQLNDRQKACAKDIHDSGKHLLDIVNAVLDMSKIEAGRYELSEEPLDPYEAVAQCLMMVRERAQDAGVDLGNALPDALRLPIVNVDRRAFKQVVLNLLSNAVKFTPEGGSITVSGRVAEDGSLAISVTDTGIGIAPEFLAHLFEPFRQADTSSSRRYEGTGLGLSISKNFMELHGGTLTCMSEVGGGTTMTLRLPADRVFKSEAEAIKAAMTDAAA